MPNKIENIPMVSFYKGEKLKHEFEVLWLEDLFARQNELPFRLDQPCRVNFYHLIFITKGLGRHWIDFEPYETSKGSLIFICQGQVHSFEPNPELGGIMLLFTEAFLQENMIHSDLLAYYRLYNYHLHSPVLQPEDVAGDIFQTLFQQIHEEFKAPDDFARPEILRSFLKLVLLKAERIKSTLVSGAENTDWFIKFSEFRAFLEKRFTQTRNARDYAEELGVSYKHLNRICKAITGCTAKRFIDNYVVLEIKRRLATSGISIKELTYELGFDEPTNLVKYFKKNALISPSHFRRDLVK
jgi:AraC-like DNA-binding protein